MLKLAMRRTVAMLKKRSRVTRRKPREANLRKNQTKSLLKTRSASLPRRRLQKPKRRKLSSQSAELSPRKPRLQVKPLLNRVRQKRPATSR